MPHRARLDVPGTLHHVIVRGIEKRRIVNDVAARKNFVNRLGYLAARKMPILQSWCVTSI
jgi:putative transposase